MGRKSLTISILLIIIMLNGCRSYYQRMYQFHSYFESGQIDKAAETLAKDKKGQKRRTRLLHLMNMGKVHHMLGNYNQSNNYFEQAYILGDDFSRNITDETLAILTNPRLTEYKGEDFELLMIHYYKAMNFIQLGKFEAALVECRRLNIRLNALADKYPSDNRYKNDAFIHNLMGIIYDATGDFNNAFIAYRNAYNAYKDDYTKLFGIQPPQQLKLDLLRTASRSGMRDQLNFYQNELGITLPASQPQTGELVFFWQNGMGPVKHEWSLNFTILRGVGGRVDFVNEELGLAFPFFLQSSGNSTGGLGDLKMIRVAFPKYLERKPIYHRARIRTNNQTTELQLAQNINDIAFQSLNDRMMRELGKALLRLAVKQAAEQAVRKENQNAGALLSIVNAVTEQADTRNWQTLPHSIHYARIALPQGEHNVHLELFRGGNVTRTVNLNTRITAGATTFMNFHTLDSNPPAAR